MIYRKDLDGIRAIAVIAVILYHLNKNYLPNGFLGVDIFLVLSGFLITSIIQDGLKRQAFNLFDFLKRRFFRIYPAYFAVIALTLIIGSVLLPRDAFNLVKNAGLQSVLGLPNVFYYRHVAESYFQISSISPLLHLWSLGLELQFYLVWSILLLTSHRLRVPIKYPIVGLTLLSFLLANYLYTHPTALTLFGREYLLNRKFVFYLLPCRIWEFGLGALASMAMKPFQNAKINQALSVLGLFCIGLALCFLSHADEFSPLVALLPCLGTCLVIAFLLENTAVSKGLSSRLLVSIGLISYSLYLWHLPMIEFFKYVEPSFGFIQQTLSLLCFVILAILSYFYIESYFRQSKSWVNFSKYASLCAALTLCFYLVNKQEINSDFYRFTSDYPGSCFFDPGEGINHFNKKRCTVGPSAFKPNILVVGSSHTNNFVPFLAVFAQKYGFSFINLTANSTAFTKKYIAVNSKEQLDSARLELHDKLYKLATHIASKTDILITCPSWAETKPKLFAKTLATWSRQFKMVILINHIPLLEQFTLKRHQSSDIHFFNKQGLAFLEEEAKHYDNVYFVSLNEFILDKKGLDDKKHALFYDSSHLNIGGSLYLARAMIDNKIPSVFNSRAFLDLSSRQ